MLTLAKDGGNFRQVVNGANVGAKFETFNGKTFEIAEYKKAHRTWSGEIKDGAKTEVRLKDSKGKVTTWETDTLRAEFCPEYVKGTKERKERETPQQKFDRLINEALSIEGISEALTEPIRSAYESAKVAIAEAQKRVQIEALEAQLRALRGE